MHEIEFTLHYSKPSVINALEQSDIAVLMKLYEMKNKLSHSSVAGNNRFSNSNECFQYA